MGKLLYDFLERNDFHHVTKCLKRVVGQKKKVVTDDEMFRREVLNYGWQSMPPVIRIQTRFLTHWDDYLKALRREVFDLSQDTVLLRSHISEPIRRLAQTILLVKNAEPPLAKPIDERSASSGDAARSKRRMPSEPFHRDDEGECAVGIDLGTTQSLIAFVDADGKPTTIPNGAGDRLTPSVVLFDNDETIVGKEALASLSVDPEKVAESFKRDMGAKVYRKKINGEYLPPEVISSFVLASLKRDAEQLLGPVHKAVITVPAYFEETRRRATMDAGKLAGFEVLDIINEPTAAAIAYGHAVGFMDRSGKLKKDGPMRVLVFDLGGGTFDVTILEIDGSDYRTLATDGDVYLGGKDWDEKLVEIAAEQFRQKTREDPRRNPLSNQQLWLGAETAKRTLTERRSASIYVHHLGQQLKVKITREEFEEAAASLVERTRMTTEIVMRQAHLEWPQLDRILLVGGSTRMPMIVRMLEELSDRPLRRSIWVDEAVALGAALYAERLAPRTKSKPTVDFTFRNVNSHSLGIQGSDPESGLKINKVLIPKNTPLPHTITKAFKTSKPNQRSVMIRILEGESERPEACTQIGTCAIRDLPSDLPAGWPVEVRYTYEPNGRLLVAGKIKGHPSSVKTDFMRENSLDDDDLKLWLSFVQQEIQEH